MIPRHVIRLIVMALFTCHASGQSPSVPAAYSGIYSELQGYLNGFDATVSSQWNGAKSPVAFGGALTSADCNRGLQSLLLPTTLTSGVQVQLNGLVNAGVRSVVISVAFPILYQPFYQYDNDPQDYAKVLGFYQSVMAEARKRGLKVVIESSVMFPNVATDLPLTAYYATLTTAQVTAGRAQVAQTIAQQLQPDWLNLGSEPDTQSALLGLSGVYTPQQYATEISTIVTQLRNAGIARTPLIGCGVGTWAPNASAFVSAECGTGIDFIDLHIYTANLGFLAAAPPLLDQARAAGKGVAISEAWMRKLDDSQLQGKSDLAIEAVLSSSGSHAVDTFSFWAPLDAQFFGELAKLAYWKNLYYVAPFEIQYFFATLDYTQVGALSADQINAQETTAANAALRQGGVLTATGQSYAALLAQDPMPSRLTSLSIRGAAGAGDQTLIVGFAINGFGSKQVLLRGIGPALAQFGVAGALADPQLTLFAGNTAINQNAGWGGGAALSNAFAAVFAFPLPPNSRDAALLVSLPSGPYSAQVASPTGTGVALVEAYDAEAGLSSTRFVSLSARNQVGTGDNVLIAGFVVSGDTSKTLLIRAVGPSLTQYGVSGVLADPKLQLYNGSTLLQENNDWGGTPALSSAFTTVNEFALPPNSKDSAMLITLPPGIYTAQVSGVGATTGVALLEVYEMP